MLNTQPALWTVEYFVDGTTTGAAKAYAANPTDIRWVGFGIENSGVGTVDNFLLTEAVLEPGSAEGVKDEIESF